MSTQPPEDRPNAAEERAKRLEGIRELRHVGADAPAMWLAMQVPFLLEELDRVESEFNEERHELVRDRTRLLLRVSELEAAGAKTEGTET